MNKGKLNKEKGTKPDLQVPVRKKSKRKTRAQKTIERLSCGKPADTLPAIVQREMLLEEVRHFNLFSDIFLSVALNDISACQHVLRILTGIEDLIVREVRTHYSISMAVSHDAYLDILAEDGAGKLYNMELQRADTVDHARRTRFYGSMLDSEFLQKGKTYAELPDVCVIYISEKDIWKKGRAVYRVSQYLEETGEAYADGRSVIYVNAEIEDGSGIAELMRYFRTADPRDSSQGDLSKRIHFLKTEERGRDIMCEVSERLIQMGKEIGIEQGIEKGLEQGIEQGIEKGAMESKRTTAWNLLRMGMPAEVVAQAVEENISLVRKWRREMPNRLPVIQTKLPAVRTKSRRGIAGRFGKLKNDRYGLLRRERRS